MALIVCPECKKSLSDTVNSCPHCGFKLDEKRLAEIRENATNIEEEQQKKSQTTKNVYKFGCLSIIVIFILVAAFSSIPSSGSGSSSTKSSTAVVYNSSLDASVFQVKSWLKANAKDPNSLEYIEWSKVQEVTGGEFLVRVKYRAKNSLGGYVIENKLFTLDSTGKVISQIDY